MEQFESYKEQYDDYCYECGGYGDDYSVVDEELVCNCFNCPMNPLNEEV